MEIAVDVRGGTKTWDEGAITDLARFALEYMKVPEGCEVSISLVDIDEIHELNKQYRDIDRPTDVLSFECDDPWQAGPDDPHITIGDVVIAPDVVDAQRAEFDTSFEQEASLMLVHSILHLLGYDHMEPDDARAMQAKEKEILDAYGLTGIR